MSDETSTLNKGVQILLKRMDSNPDEFMKTKKWDSIMKQLVGRVDNNTKDMLPMLTDEECHALMSKFNKIRRDDFTSAVMAKVLQANEEEEADSFGLAQAKAQGAKYKYDQALAEAKVRQLEYDIRQRAAMQNMNPLSIGRVVDEPVPQRKSVVEALKEWIS